MIRRLNTAKIISRIAAILRRNDISFIIYMSLLFFPHYQKHCIPPLYPATSAFADRPRARGVEVDKKGLNLNKLVDGFNFQTYIKLRK